MIFPALLQGWGREEGTGLGKKASCGEKADDNPASNSRGTLVEVSECWTLF